MSNWNLESFDYLYSSLAESAYTNRPNWFPYEQLSPEEQKALNSGKSLKFDYSKSAEDKDGQVTEGGSHFNSKDPNNDGIVYLQPDQEGLLEDKDTGYNAYYLSENETIDQNTKQTYFVVRGSDGYGNPSLEHPEDLKNTNDWINNDAAFALQDAIVPQAKVATKGMKEKIAELESQAAPEAKMSITGHSLGTMVSIQGAAGLSSQELDRVDQIVLFNGPDATKSLQKAGYSDEKIQQLGDKTTYYVNPLDPVSMLNRDKPYEQQLGTVHVIVPTDYTSMMEEGRSSHDFGAYQMGSDGKPLVASENYHPELLTAGQDLAKLERDSIEGLKKYVPDTIIDGLVNLSPAQYQSVAKDIGDIIRQIKDGVDLSDITALPTEIKETIKAVADSLGISQTELLVFLGNAAVHWKDIVAIWTNFQDKYEQLIKDTKAKSLKWDRDHIDSFHDKIKKATGNDRILLRTELLYMATQLAEEDVTNQVEAAKKHISGVKDEVKTISEVAITVSKTLGVHLSDSEIEELTSEIKLSNVWDDGVEEADKSALDTYKSKLDTFGSDLVFAAQNIEAVDAQQAGDIFANLSQK